ncbi:vacuolar fusion protein MON1 homolog A [Drosophila grimshawi]|uniref:Vacuolar fusion protein MON1 homolog n=1 Tax=Drosophila grimshawi TaxID=7222 RepID=B4JQA9_DROGR|nr:vacuolar fusion protein MON1 homolog A [Drosophila grimshawi]EDV99089.1 GH13226 [Drosophila grimshawi]
METEQTPTPNTATSDTNSTCEYLDAEGDSEHETGDLYQEADADAEQQHHQGHNIISEAVSGQTNKDLTTSVESLALSTSTSAKTEDSVSTNAVEEDLDDYQHDSVWRGQKKHIFILSEAGKPIYSLHGNEDKLAALFGVIQVLVSIVQRDQDGIISIHAGGIKFAFMHRNSLILVAASRTNMSIQQLQLQLSDVYYQILSLLTHSHLSKTFERRKNFDLRRSLAGSERLIFNLLANDSSNARVSSNIFTFLTNSIRVFPLPTAVRSNIISAIQSNCSKVKDLVFAVLIADNKLIALVRMKKYSIHPSDLRLIFNLIECTESFKNSPHWLPICLPKFNMNGFWHAHISYLTNDCPACLLLISVDKNASDIMQSVKMRITEKLERSQCLQAINEELQEPHNAKLYQQMLSMPELRHFLYKPKATAQLLFPMLRHPYKTLSEFERLEAIYCSLLHRIHNQSRPLKLIYELRDREVILAWVTATYELYAVFESIVDKATVIKYVDKLIKWIEKEYDVYFIRNHATF